MEGARRHPVGDEGEDKSWKYRHIFRSSQLMLRNKTDLLPHHRFDVARCVAYARRVNPSLVVIQVSAVTGQGMASWYDWLRTSAAAPSPAETISA